MDYKIITIAFLITFSTNFCQDLPQNPKEDYKPLPPGTTYFSFTNYNNQHLNMTESRREVQTHISHQPPPVIVTPNPIETFSAPQSELKLQTSERNLFSSCFDWLKNLPNSLFTYKSGVLIAGTVALAYGALWIQLLKHASKAKNKSGWASFQEHIPPQHLLALPHLSLAEGLLEEIKNRYPTINAQDMIPLALKEFEQEREELTNFLSFHEWLAFLKLSIIFPDQKKLISQAKIKIQRLVLFKDALNEWNTIHSARLIENIERISGTTPFNLIITRQDETDVIELPTYAI